MASPRACFSPEFPLEQVPGSKGGWDVLAYECPTSGTGDFREPMLEVRHPDGTTGLRLVYVGHRLIPGKPPLPQLPSVYTESKEESDTLEIDLQDQRLSPAIWVTLRYTVFAGRDVLTRSCCIHNKGTETLTLLRALSAALDLPATGQEIFRFKPPDRPFWPRVGVFPHGIRFLSQQQTPCIQAI